MSTSNDVSDPQFTLGLGDVSVSAPLSNDFATDGLLQMIRKAAVGGDATVSYFTMMSAYSSMYGQLITNGINAWNVAQDENNLDIYYITEQDGQGNQYTIRLALQDLQVDGDGNIVINGSTVTKDGITYNGFGYVNVTTSFNAFDLASVATWIGVAGAGAFSLGLVATAIRACQAQAAEQIPNVLGRVAGQAGGGQALDDTISTADTEASEAMTEEAGVEILTAGTLTFLGVTAIIAVVFIVLSFLLHVTSQSVKFWNLTRFKALYTFWFDEGALYNGPVTFDSSGKITSTIPNDGACFGVPVEGAKPVYKCHYQDFNFNSDSETNGIGYVMQIQLVNPNNESDIKYTVTLMFDIPYVGDNSTSITFDNVPVSNLQSWYDSQEGVNKTTSFSATSSDSVITATTTYDYLSGPHPVPVPVGTPSNEAYFYQSLIILDDNGLTAQTCPPCPTTSHAHKH